jgi:predicted exporter/SAM-dependent methyltransferase
MRLLYFNVKLLIVTLAVIGGLFWAGTRLTAIDTDITRYLPQGDPVLADAGYIFAHHPIQGEMAIDLGLSDPSPDLLVQYADDIEQRLRQSGLFSSVGTESMQTLIPELVDQVNENLPLLFTRRELEEKVAPLLAPESIAARMAEIREQLLGLDAIGQARMIAQDPLGIKNIVMTKLALLAPSRQIEFYRGKLLSPDRQHLLIIATPSAPGTDTAFAIKIDALMKAIAAELPGRVGQESTLTMTPMGAYRAALDNERLAKQDVQNAALFSTIGIALLLLLTFPRPLIGLFSFLPAVAGTVAAFFVMALFNKSISIMALGFGGAIVSITVDQGIAYLLFLDQPRTTYGHDVSSEIWGIELMVTLTTVGAFAALTLTGFPILSQLGQFAAMGAAFAFLFVHFIFPKIFPELPPARHRPLPFRRAAMRLTTARPRIAWCAAAFCAIMLLFARPVFNTDLRAMNTVSRETSAAERLLGQVWGSGIFNKIFLMNEAPNASALHKDSDRILAWIEEDIAAGRIAAGFSTGMVFPGPERAKRNLEDWKSFWTQERIAATFALLAEQSEAWGFTTAAFEKFRQKARAETPLGVSPSIPDKFHSVMGISRTPSGGYSQFVTLTPGDRHDSESFLKRYGSVAKIFEPALFSQRLGDLLFSTFTKMLLVAGVSVAILIFFFLLDLKLTLITLSPALFAQICTMGTLKLSGQPLDIPVLMLAIVIMGMGIDYGLLLVCSYQRFGGLNEPGCERIKMAMILGAFSAMIGFAVLCLAEHSLLRSAGLTSLLGIGYSLVGAFVLLPPLLEHHFRSSAHKVFDVDDRRSRILGRYRDLETYPRLFARFKLKSDPMFEELPGLLNGTSEPKVILDIGCGYGLPGCWMLDHFPTGTVYGIDPDRERIRVAARVFGDRGNAQCDLAPNIPLAPEAADLAFMLDVIHFLDDSALRLTLQRLHPALRPDGVVVIRAVVPPPDMRRSWHWHFDALKMKWSGVTGHYRTVDRITEIMTETGFESRHASLSGENPESAWIIAVPLPGAKATDTSETPTFH